jgi:hypothetical protein
VIVALTAADAGFYSAVIVAFLAAVPGGLAYRRGKRTDERTGDLDTLREIVSTLRAENDDQRRRLTQLDGRVDQCEAEKDGLKTRVFELHMEVFRLKAGNG